MNGKWQSMAMATVNTNQTMTHSPIQIESVSRANPVPKTVELTSGIEEEKIQVNLSKL